MNNVYNISWSNFIILNLPVQLRKSRLIKLIEVFFKPLILLHSEFLVFRIQSLYKVNHNSQICYLQAVLNDSFDPQRGIKIENATLKEPLWFYEPEENAPVYFYEESDNKPVYFQEESDFAGDGVDFTVIVPTYLKITNLSDEENNRQNEALFKQMQGQIDYYKLFVKNYKIVWD